MPYHVRRTLPSKAVSELGGSMIAADLATRTSSMVTFDGAQRPVDEVRVIMIGK